MNESAHPYSALSPDTILDALESVGYACTGHILPLNSYENRVLQIGLDEMLSDAPFVIVKFYRPNRWTSEAILEEHEFAQELRDNEVPMVAPLQINGTSLHEYQGFQFAVYPRCGGRIPELDRQEHLALTARMLGRLHSIGRRYTFQHRSKLNVDTFGFSAQETILGTNFLADYQRHNYEQVSNDLLGSIKRQWQDLEFMDVIRVHGDCHAGNILWTDSGPHFVDLDDTVMAPAIQDLWMLLSGTRAEQESQLAIIVEEYSTFAEFTPFELRLVEPLRTLRMMRHAAWLANRWNDPAFPKAFPWFAESRFWDDHILALREQLPLLEEEPLTLDFS